MKRCTNFLMTEEKVFIKYMEILEKVSNIIKNKFNSELISSKKYIKAEKKKKKTPAKRVIQCLYAPVIMINSI